MASNLRMAVVVGTCRLSFPELVEPNEDGKFSTQMIIPKDAVLKRPGHKDMPIAQMIKAIQHMCVATAKDKFGDSLPAAIAKYIKGKEFLRDGDEKYEEDPEKNWMYEGCWILSASKRPLKRSGNAPFVVVGKNPRIPITDIEEEAYGGRYANVQVSAYSYDFEKKDGKKKQRFRGVALGLEAIQVVDIDGDPGEPFSSFSPVESAEDAFGMDESMDDPSFYEDDDLNLGATGTDDEDDDLGI